MLKERKKKRKESLNQLESNLKFISFYLKANTAAGGPPLSSVFGNLGLNTVKFCKQFNSLTEMMPSYFVLKVYVRIDLSTKSWTLKIKEMPVAALYRLLSLKTTLQLRGSGGFYFKEKYYVTLKVFFLVILFYGKEVTKKEINNKLSIIKSMDMLVLN